MLDISVYKYVILTNLILSTSEENYLNIILFIYKNISINYF